MDCLKCPNYWNNTTECEKCNNNKTFAEYYIETYGLMPPLIIEKGEK